MSIYPMSDLVAKEFQDYANKLKTMKLTPSKKPTKQEFAFLLSAISSTRVMPGIKKHMGYEKLHVCNHKDAKEAKRHLRDFYHINDQTSLENSMKAFYEESV